VFHIMPRLRMSGAATLLPPHASMGWTGRIVSFCYIHKNTAISNHSHFTSNDPSLILRQQLFASWLLERPRF